jgi:hypothetical protein
MHVMQGLKDLPRENTRIALREEATHDNVLVEITVRTEFNDDIIIVVVHEQIVEMDNPGMVESLVRSDLDFKTAVDVFFAKAVLRDNFARIELSRGLVDNETDSGKGALSNDPPEGIGTDAEGFDNGERDVFFIVAHSLSALSNRDDRRSKSIN